MNLKLKKLIKNLKILSQFGMDNQIEFQQEQFINLGKQLHEKEAREERFKANLKTLSDNFDERYKQIKIKKEDIFTLGSNEILDKIYENYELDCDESELVLYVRFLKYIIKQKDNELKRDKESIDDLNDMSSSYLEEINELEKREREMSEEYSRYIAINYLLGVTSVYFLLNFLMLYLVGRTSFDGFWVSLFSTVCKTFYTSNMFLVYILKGIASFIYSIKLILI